MFRWLGGFAPGRPPAITAATWRQVREIEALAPKLEALDDLALKRVGRSLSYRAKAGESINSLLVEAFAATREAGRRRLGMRHYDVQLLAGSALVRGAIAEMQTGEGKTLVATLPLVLYALAGKGVHLATVNDYLARRDAEWMAPIYEALGLKVGIVESQMDFDKRREAYACDVTYGTAKEFGFDFLKDRLIKRQLDDGSSDLGATLTGATTSGAAKLLQRPFWFALVDEADNVLIDEARTPLIISSPPGEAQAATVSLYHFAAQIAESLEEDGDFEKDVEKQSCELLGRGRSRVRAAVRPAALGNAGLLEIYESVERALRAKQFFTRDRQYVVRDGKIVIIDEFTGRAAEGRSWRDGLHQAVEAKESRDTESDEIEMTTGAGHAARVTILEPGPDVELGMSARVSAEVSAAERRIELPVAALYGKGEAMQVWVVEDLKQGVGAVRLQAVKTRGLAGDHVLVEAGIGAGDLVVIAGAQLLRAGQRVRVVSPE